MSNRIASHHYYQSCCGRWRSVFQIRITHLSEAFQSIGFFDFLSFVFLALWPSCLGRVFLETSVHAELPGPVIHRALVRLWGIPLLRSVERFHLHEDGIHFSIEGESSSLFLPWKKNPVRGKGRVHSSGMNASYEVNLNGMSLQQETCLEGEVLTLYQKGPGWEGHQRLVRQEESEKPGG